MTERINDIICMCNAADTASVCCIAFRYAGGIRYDNAALIIVIMALLSCKHADSCLVG